MGVFVRHDSCPACPSSDAFAVYEDGSGFCFSCNHYRHAEGGGAAPAGPVVPLHDGEFIAIEPRRLTRETCARYGYRVGKVGGREAQMADYHTPDGRRVAQKVRFRDKGFTWAGESRVAGLFGQHLFREGGRRVFVTEGEIDAMSLAQALDHRYPVVSVPDGAPSAAKALARQLDWLELYEAIYLVFDSDDAGRKAAAECAELFTPGKARVAVLPRKDPNEMLVAGEAASLVHAVWEASTHRPDGIVEGVELLDKIVAPPDRGVNYPWPMLNTTLYGQRRGELVCWTAGTGIGKSTLVHQVFAGLREAGEKVGIVTLEQAAFRAAREQVGLAMGRRLHLPPVRAAVGEDEIRAVGEKALKGMYFYDHLGSIDPDVIGAKVRYMAKALGVRWVMIDHISIMVSGYATDGDERKRIDELMTRLWSDTQSLNIGTHIVSHLRKASGGESHEEGGRVRLDDLRGSGSIKQCSDIIIAGERNQQAASGSNVLTLRCLKNRFEGSTGVLGRLEYDPESGRLSELPFEARGTPTFKADEETRSGI